MNAPKDLSIIVKWNGKGYPIKDISYQDTVAMLKYNIAKLTNVLPERQKLLNLKYKGKVASDDLRLSSLELKPHFKLMMIGSREADIQDVLNSSENTPIGIGIDDICDDVIDLILNRLKLEDLVNISDASKRLRNIAGSVFSRKYGNSFIAIDHFPKDDQYELRLQIPSSYKEKQMARIGDASVCFKLLRKFGEYIKYIRLYYGKKTYYKGKEVKTNLSPLSWKRAGIRF